MNKKQWKKTAKFWNKEYDVLSREYSDLWTENLKLKKENESLNGQIETLITHLPSEDKDEYDTDSDYWMHKYDNLEDAYIKLKEEFDELEACVAEQLVQEQSATADSSEAEEAEDGKDKTLSSYEMQLELNRMIEELENRRKDYEPPEHVKNYNHNPFVYRHEGPSPRAWFGPTYLPGNQRWDRIDCGPYSNPGQFHTWCSTTSSLPTADEMREKYEQNLNEDSSTS